MDAAQAAQDLLDAAAGALADPPDRRFVTVGEVVDVCEQLTVSLQGILAGKPGAGALFDLLTSPAQPVGFQLEARLVRCWPSDENPAAGALEAAGLAVIDDAERLLRGVRAAMLRDGDPLFGGCSSRTIGPLTVAGPEGGVVVLSLTVGVQD